MAECPTYLGHLYQLATELGVEFHFNSLVEKIILEGAEAKGVVVQGIEHKAKVVASNMDVVYTYRRLMPEQKAPERILEHPEINIGSHILLGY
jgi:diapolycopene oxygenase